MKSAWQSARASLLVLFLSVTAVILVIIYAMTMLSLRPATPGDEIGLSEVLRRSEAKAISSVTFLEQDARVKGVSTIQPTAFWASVPDELIAGLTDRLVRNGSTVTVDSQFGKSTMRFLAQFVLPIILLVVLFTLAMAIIRGGGSGIADFIRFGGVGNRRREGEEGEEEEGVSFSDVGGAAEAVLETREVGVFLSDPSAYQAIGAEPPRGMLLVGAPGTGKTLLARALAREASVPFLYLSGAEFVESLVGIGASRVRDLFDQARAEAPAIVFIDELDAVGRRRGTGVGMGHDEREQTLNQLLVEMDGFDKYSGIVLIGATNRPDILDPALVRPGRFDRRILVQEPDLAGRLEILEIHARRRKLGPDADLARIARETPGLSGAELASIVNEAAILAVRDGRAEVAQPDLDEALERVLVGPARRSRLSQEETRRAAYHEAGHAVVARAVGSPVAVQKVSIIARGRSVGHHAALSDGDRVLSGYDTLMADLMVTMAGLAGELVVLGDLSTASVDDIDNATKLARRLVCIYGMSEKIGRLRIGVPEEEMFLGRDLASHGQVSSGLLDDVDSEVRRLIREAEAQAASILRSNRKALDSLADRLTTVETMRGEELDAALAGVKHDGALTRLSDGKKGRAPSRSTDGSARSQRRETPSGPSKR